MQGSVYAKNSTNLGEVSMRTGEGESEWKAARVNRLQVFSGIRVLE